MIAKLLQLVRFVLKDHSGQILPWIAVAFVGAIAVTGLSLDMGHAYIVQKQLQLCADAGALAGAQVLPKDPSVQATQYSCDATGLNYSPALGSVTPQVTGGCIKLLLDKGVPCLLPTRWNIVKVTETVPVPTMFIRVLDIIPGVHLDTIPVSATATAGRTKPIPVNVAIIVDMTGSLDVPEENDIDCANNHQEFQCQLYAIQSMLQMLAPCSDGSVGSNCGADKADVRVGLFTFPNVSSDLATLAAEVTCGTGGAAFPKQSNGKNDAKNPYAITTITSAPYTFPRAGATTYSTAGLQYTYGAPAGVAPLNATYQVVDFSSDYYDDKQTYGLNASSNLVKAIGRGNGVVQGCLNFPSGIVNSGQGNTYLASSIYAAQAGLLGVQEKYKARPSNNYMIFISDGRSNVISGVNQMAAVSGGSIRNTTAKSPLNEAAPGVWPVFTGVPTSTGVTALTGTGLYPDVKDQCQQAIMAGAAATKANTIVNSIANGAGSGSGCGHKEWNGYQETETVANGQYNVAFTYSTLDACTTMKDIASDLGNFYSTTTQGCTDGIHTGANTLAAIFKKMGFGLVRATLIPNSAK